MRCTPQLHAVYPFRPCPGKAAGLRSDPTGIRSSADRRAYSRDHGTHPADDTGQHNGCRRRSSCPPCAAQAMLFLCKNPVSISHSMQISQESRDHSGCYFITYLIIAHKKTYSITLRLKNTLNLIWSRHLPFPSSPKTGQADVCISLWTNYKLLWRELQTFFEIWYFVVINSW